jgi:hypothetical protein
MATWAGGTVTNCTEAALRAALVGGAVVTFACDGTITLAETIMNDTDTIIDGTGHQIILSGGDGVGLFCVANPITLTLINLTLANGRSDYYGGAIYNLSGTVNATNCTSSGNSVTNVGSMNNTDPILGPLAANGGPTLTMALLPGSPAIDGGDTAAAPAADQRGFPRPAGLAADIGAFEYGSVLPALTINGSAQSGLELFGSGNAGQFCRLLASTDLSRWIPISTNQFGANGAVVFHDSSGYDAACRFYRLTMP